jgi:CubicO group peptidase (beta-lactamase class C family)/D-alanyl-D-alanine dipeptidase
MFLRLRTRPKLLSALSIILLCASCSSRPGRIAERREFNAAIAELERVITHELESKGIPSLSIAIEDRTGTIWTKAFGMADPGKKIAATPESVYRIGEVSGLLTEVAVMQLVEQGVLDLDAPLSTYVPEFTLQNTRAAPPEREISLRQLLSARSGLVQEPPVGNYLDVTQPTLRDTVRSLNSTRLEVPHGPPRFSNAAIAVAGHVVERAKGIAFADYMQRTILDPLGMNSSSFELTDAIKARLAKGRMRRSDLKESDAPVFRLGALPAVNMYATMPDLARFVHALIHGGGKLLKPDTLNQMWAPQVRDAGKGYGIGFHADQFYGRRRIWHEGSVYGFTTDFNVLPGAQLGVCVSASMDAANAVVRRITEHALRLMLAVQEGDALAALPLTNPVDPALARKLDGLYSDKERKVELRERGGKLFIEGFAWSAEVRALGGGLFVDDLHEFGTKIVPGTDQIGLNRHILRRVTEPRPAPPPEAWNPLIGEYGSDDNPLCVFEKDGSLCALAGWTETAQLQEVRPDRFVFLHYGAMYDHALLELHRNSRGKVTEAVFLGATFPRRAVSPEEGRTFTVTPVRPVAELRREALAADMPQIAGDYLKSDLVEIVKLDSTIKLDIRYASTDNFLKTAVYGAPRAFLQRPAAEALVRVHRKLKKLGYGLLIHDAYRPWYVTRMFWDATPGPLRIFVADPAKGSIHNRGSAVDLTLYDLRTGRPVQMVSGYDEMSDRAFAYYIGGTSLQRWSRDLLRKTMEEEDFSVYPWEWWHFDHASAGKYPVMNVTFDQIR